MAVGFGIFTKLLPWLVEGQQVNPQVDQRGRLIVSSGDNAPSGVLTVTTVDLDTNGNVVPTWKAQSFTYDDNGNLYSARVVSGADSWVRTYGVYVPGGPVTDSGWVKQ